MAGIDALRRRVAALRARVDAPEAQRQWIICLEEDEEPDAELLAQMGPHDQLTILYYPRGYMGVDGACSEGQVMYSQGRRMLRRTYGVDISKV